MSAPTAAATSANAAASAPPKTATLAELLAAAATTKLRRTKAFQLEHRARIGVYFGLPDGWRNDDPSWLSLYPKDLDGPSGGARFVAMRLSDPGLTEANLKRLLKRGTRPTQLVDPRWEPWVDGHAGAKRWPAKIARASGDCLVKKHSPLAAIAAVVDVPDTPAVGVMGAWPKGQTELAEVIANIVRHLHRCQVQVGRGCVPDE